MYISTFIPEGKYADATTNRQINEAVEKIRLATGKDIRVEERSFWNGQKEVKRYLLYIEINRTHSEFRTIEFHTEETTKIAYDASAVEVLNYLTGILTGLTLKGEGQ